MNLFRLLFLLVIMGTVVNAPAQTRPGNGSGNLWEVVHWETAGMAVPKQWRSVDSTSPRMLLYRSGDGIGVPAVDENGSPLQIGLTVEKFPNTKGSIAQGADAMAAAAKRNPALELVGKESIEELKLADGTEAKLLTMEFIKGKSRRSLQFKLVAKDADSNGWVISGFIVGGKESKIPTGGSDIAKWLRAHLASFCLDAAKVDESKMKDAYEKKGKQE